MGRMGGSSYRNGVEVGVSSCWVVAVALGLVVASCSWVQVAADEDPKQDVCVANLDSEVYANGFSCRRQVQSSDFASTVLRTAGALVPEAGVSFATANVFTFPGLNTQGLAMNRVDYEPRGLAIPHHHPRASEMIIVTQGTLISGFMTTDRQPGIDNITVIEGIQPDLRLYTNTLQQYDVAIFPRALMHWVFNPSYNETAQYIAAYNSQNQGFAPTVPTLFNSTPPIPDSVLAIALQLSEEEVRRLRMRIYGRHY